VSRLFVNPPAVLKTYSTIPSRASGEIARKMQGASANASTSKDAVHPFSLLLPQPLHDDHTERRAAAW
jgi:hypothetical protein